jgi:long-chain fatty acid transport protein
MRLTKIAALFAAAGISVPAFATNGMNQAGYGPISESMGGTSMAYDNGVAAVINNPATLGFMASGTARMDLGLGDLRPLATANGQSSTAKDFFMPGLGYARKDGNLAWGVGLMAQGGMGTDYSDGSFWGTLQPATGGYMAGGAANLVAERAAGQSLRNMSEVGVGRVMFPLAFSVTPDLTVGGSVDYVWAGMDIKWLIDGAHFKDLAPAFGGAQTFGTLTGAGVGNLLSFMPGGASCGAPGCINDLGWGYFDFEKSGKFTQEAKGTGWAGNIGFTYKVSPDLTVGGVYHAKTSLSDMTTSSGGAKALFNINSTGGATNPFGPAGQRTVTVTGKVTIKDFQWPETYAVGMSYKANAQWQFAADYKRINWAATMKALSMKFEGSMSGIDMGMDLVYKQQWENQNVFQFGAAYQYNDALSLRFGANIANNPIPDKYVSPLFPAVMKDHFSAGFGYAFSKMDSLDGALVYAPKVSVTNNWSAVSGPLGATSNSNVSLGTTSSWQLMYSHRY